MKWISISLKISNGFKQNQNSLSDGSHVNNSHMFAYFPFARMICTLSYFTLILYISQGAGNPFLNFFIQSAAEAPAFFLGTYMGKFCPALIIINE